MGDLPFARLETIMNCLSGEHSFEFHIAAYLLV
jgi:hypothetical protein